jgi:hypothetical protein
LDEGRVQRLANVSPDIGDHGQGCVWVLNCLSIAMFQFPKGLEPYNIKDGLATMLLKGNLKATSRLLQDDIFQDVFENVGLFCGDSHCNVGDTKEECLDSPNQAKMNHQNSSDWKELWEIQNFAWASASVLLGCLFWLLLPAPQHLCLNVQQVGQCLVTQQTILKRRRRSRLVLSFRPGNLLKFVVVFRQFCA